MSIQTEIRAPERGEIAAQSGHRGQGRDGGEHHHPGRLPGAGGGHPRRPLRRRHRHGERHPGGKTAYVKGEKITGSIPTWYGFQAPVPSPSFDGYNVKLEAYTQDGGYLAKGSPVILETESTNFGNATPPTWPRARASRAPGESG